VERGRAFASRPLARASASGICLLQPRHHRPDGLPAVGDRVERGRPLGAGAVRHAAVFQTGTLFAGAALAAGGAPCRAPHAVRLRRDPDRRGAAVRLTALCDRAQRSARQVRHHSAGDVVGDRHARHGRLWRRGAGDAARQDRIGVYHRRRLCDDRAAGRDRLARIHR
jgi:hypothetical protein